MTPSHDPTVREPTPREPEGELGASRPEEALDRPLHILLAEDDDELRARFTHVLESAGWRVTEMSDGEQARDFFRACLQQDAPRPKIDCFVTDVRMPGCDGLEVMQLVQDLGRYFPTVIVTGYGDLNTWLEAKELGASVMLDKPVRARDLERAVRRAVSAPIA